MRIALNLWWVMLGLWTSSVSGMSLGEGHILNQIGEPFAARIDLPGTFDPAVRFYPVKAAECRSSLLGKTVTDCESLYEGALSLSTWRRTDGQYALKLSGGRSDEMFYRVILKAVSATGGTTFRSYEFLPEFRTGSAVPVLDDSALDVVVDSGNSAGKLGVVKVADSVADEAGPVSTKAAVVKPARPAAEKREPLKPESRRGEKAVAVPAEKQVAQPRLEIKKFGDYSDDIHALQNENVAIEAQIALLEKHIGLLKEVVRLKGQIGASSVAEAGVMAAPAASAPALAKKAAPVVVSVPSPAAPETGLLTWILLAVVLALAAAVGVMYTRLKKINVSNAGETTSTLPAAALNEMKSLDLTGVFVKPKW